MEIISFKFINKIIGQEEIKDLIITNINLIYNNKIIYFLYHNLNLLILLKNR